METKKTYKELNELINSINSVIGKQETKTQKKLFKVYEKVKKHHENYQYKIEELRLDNAATDEKGFLLLDEKGEYKFSKEGLKNLNKQLVQLLDETFDFTLITVINTSGLDSFHFLKDWTTNITFVEDEDEL